MSEQSAIRSLDAADDGGAVAASCPVDGAVSVPPLALSDRLYVPHRKRLIQSYVVNEDGVRELHIDYGVKEVSFDEPHLFEFGERLVREPSFTGEQAVTWGPGYRWDELRPLLEVLIDEGIIKRGGSDEEGSVDPRGGGLVPSLLPPSQCERPRMWSLADCEELSRELGGRAFEIGALEAVVPVYRIAHPALDGDHRQIGEANVFPPRLRLNIETEWRACQYPGSRYRDKAPMNITGLRAMIKHWKPIMKTLMVLRGALRERFGPSDVWSVGELHLFACVVLAFPTYGLMKGGGTSPPPLVHPVLSSLFRITDGIRMTTFEMLFAVEHAKSADTPMTAAELYEHAELNAILIGETGVCAGPKPLIDEFLANAIDGVPPEGLDEVELPGEVVALLAELPQAIDYGLLGMMVWGTSLSIWLEMSRVYEEILPIFERAFAAGGAPEPLLARLRRDWHMLEVLQLTRPYDRDVHEKAYLDAYERGRRALRVPVGAPRFADAVAPVPQGEAHRELAARMAGMWEARRKSGVLAGLEPEDVASLTSALVRLLRCEQAAIAATEVAMREINALLERPTPRRPLDVRDFLSFYSVARKRGVYPYVFDTLEEELGIFVAATSSAMDLVDLHAP